MSIDLNADVGEGEIDEPLYAVVTSINIACGGHAGDMLSMARALEASKRYGLAAGAHPSYEDREHFGRRELNLGLAEIKMQILEQLERIAAIADRHEVELTHVKPHGALYNQAAADPLLAMVIAEALSEAHPELRLVGLAGSALPAVGRDAGLSVAEEGFADRAYRADGSLAPRDMPGALITDPATAATQAVALARGEAFTTIDGARITVKADTICCHGDTPGAIDIARAVYDALERAGIEVARL